MKKQFGIATFRKKFSLLCHFNVFAGFAFVTAFHSTAFKLTTNLVIQNIQAGRATSPPVVSLFCGVAASSSSTDLRHRFVVVS
jgi:hypothetical protein